MSDLRCEVAFESRVARYPEVFARIISVPFATLLFLAGGHRKLALNVGRWEVAFSAVSGAAVASEKTGFTPTLRCVIDIGEESGKTVYSWITGDKQWEKVRDWPGKVRHIQKRRPLILADAFFISFSRA